MTRIGSSILEHSFSMGKIFRHLDAASQARTCSFVTVSDYNRVGGPRVISAGHFGRYFLFPQSSITLSFPSLR